LALALLLAKSLADFDQSQAETKILCSQHTKHGTAGGPFHPLHMGTMSDAAVSRRLCVVDFGHVMPSWPWHCCWPKVWQISARAKSKRRFFAASTPSMTLVNFVARKAWMKNILNFCQLFENLSVH
jgi:hypothetical protein